MNYASPYKIYLQHFYAFCQFFCNIFTYIKMSKDSSAKYYQNNIERLPKKARERYQSLSKEEKENQKNCREQYKNLPEDEEQKLVE